LQTPNTPATAKIQLYHRWLNPKTDSVTTDPTPNRTDANQHGVYTSSTRTFRYPFQYPQNVFYIFGHEDGGISQQVTGRADDVIYVPPMAA